MQITNIRVERESKSRFLPWVCSYNLDGHYYCGVGRTAKGAIRDAFYGGRIAQIVLRRYAAKQAAGISLDL